MFDETSILLYNAMVLLCVVLLAAASNFWPLIFLWFVFRIPIKVYYESIDDSGEEEEEK